MARITARAGGAWRCLAFGPLSVCPAGVAGAEWEGFWLLLGLPSGSAVLDGAPVPAFAAGNAAGYVPALLLLMPVAILLCGRAGSWADVPKLPVRGLFAGDCWLSLPRLFGLVSVAGIFAWGCFSGFWFSGACSVFWRVPGRQMPDLCSGACVLFGSVLFGAFPVSCVLLELFPVPCVLSGSVLLGLLPVPCVLSGSVLLGLFPVLCVLSGSVWLELFPVPCVLFGSVLFGAFPVSCVLSGGVWLELFPVFCVLSCKFFSGLPCGWASVLFSVPCGLLPGFCSVLLLVSCGLLLGFCSALSSASDGLFCVLSSGSCGRPGRCPSGVLSSLLPAPALPSFPPEPLKVGRFGGRL